MAKPRRAPAKRPPRKPPARARPRRPARRAAPPPRARRRAPPRPAVAPPATPSPAAPTPTLAPPIPGLPTRRTLLIAFLLFAAGVLVYADNIERPPGITFDEAHYVKAARHYTNGTIVDPAWGDPRPVNFEHPPFAKYLIALSMKTLGDGEAGWRGASVVVGASGLAAVYLLGSRLFQSTGAGLVAALFLLWDPMYFLHARISMLDVFPAAFGLWAFALGMAASRRQRAAGALFLGLAIASKYVALFLVPVFLLLQLARSRPGRAVHRWAEAVLISLAVPLVVWLATYVPYFTYWAHHGGFSVLLQEFLLIQVAAFAWDFASNARHDYASKPWTWLPMIKPVWYAVTTYPDGRVAYVYSVGNPALWWPAAAAAFLAPILVPIQWVRRHARHHLDRTFLSRLPHYSFQFTPASQFLLASLLFLTSYLPFFLLQRVAFLFYATLFAPYLALVGAGVAQAAWRRGRFLRALALSLIVLVGFFFVLWYPLASGAPVAKAHYEALRWVVPWMQTAAAA